MKGLLQAIPTFTDSVTVLRLITASSLPVIDVDHHDELIYPNMACRESIHFHHLRKGYRYICDEFHVNDTMLDEVYTVVRYNAR